MVAQQWADALAQLSEHWEQAPRYVTQGRHDELLALQRDGLLLLDDDGEDVIPALIENA